MKYRLFLAVFLTLPFSSPAEVILLKSGRMLEGKITERTDRSVTLDYRGVSLTFYLDELESINGKIVGGKKEGGAAAGEEGEINKDYLARVVKMVGEKTKRRRREVTLAMDAETLSMQAEGYIDADYPEGIFYSQGRLKKIEVNFPKAADETVEMMLRTGEIASTDKESARKQIVRVEEIIEHIVETLKGIKSSAFFIDGVLYNKFGDEWVRLAKRQENLFWDIEMMLKEGRRGDDIIKRYPFSLLEAAGYFLAANHPSYNQENIYDITRGNFAGKPCYVVSLKKESFIAWIDKLKDFWLHYYRISGKDLDATTVSFKGYRYNLFVARDTYRTLGATIAYQMRIDSPLLPEVKKFSFKIDVKDTYPEGPLDYLPGRKEGAERKDEKEYLKLLLGDLDNRIFPPPAEEWIPAMPKDDELLGYPKEN